MCWDIESAWKKWCTRSSWVHQAQFQAVFFYVDFYLPGLCGLECLSSYVEVSLPHRKGWGVETPTKTHLCQIRWNLFIQSPVESGCGQFPQSLYVKCLELANGSVHWVWGMLTPHFSLDNRTTRRLEWLLKEEERLEEEKVWEEDQCGLGNAKFEMLTKHARRNVELMWHLVQEWGEAGAFVPLVML